MAYASRRLSTKAPKTPKQRFSRKRQIIIIASATALLLGLAIAYIIYSVYSWNGAQASAASLRDDVKSSIGAKLASPSAPTNIEVELTNFAKEYKASTIGDQCDLPVLVSWQSSLWFTKEATAHCQSENKDAREVISHLDDLRVYVVQSNMIAKKLSEAAKNANAKKLNFADAKKVWESAVTNIETQTVDDSVVSVRTDTIDAIKGVIAAYDGIQQAEKSQDRTKYDASIDALGKAYDVTATVTGATKEHYTTLLNEFLDAYKKL